MFLRILVPVDGSQRSERSLDLASALALKFGSELRLVTVEEVPLPVYAGETSSRLLQETRRDEASYLATCAQQLQSLGCRVNTAILPPGAPAERILEEARRYGADLIVMGSHGRTGIARALLGSVAERLAREAPCAVMIQRNQGEHK